MSKTTLIDAIAKKAGITRKQATDAADIVFNTIQAALKKDNKFGLVGFGTFTVRKRAARTGRNPQTGEALKIKASKSVGFKAGAALKKAVK